MTLGLTQGTVVLSPHREEWHQLFDKAKERILEAIGEYVVSIEHVGSTAICGIVAKPVLDIMVGIPRFDYGEKCVKPLERLGYEYKGENGVPGRHYFGKGKPRIHHLHMVPIESEFWKHHLLFRDHLRNARSAAREYNDLKLALARRFPDDREAYTNGKEAFVNRILREARQVKTNE